jgi:hypothetical protein
MHSGKCTDPSETFTSEAEWLVFMALCKNPARMIKMALQVLKPGRRRKILCQLVVLREARKKLEGNGGIPTFTQVMKEAGFGDWSKSTYQRRRRIVDNGLRKPARGRAEKKSKCRSVI